MHTCRKVELLTLVKFFDLIIRGNTGSAPEIEGFPGDKFSIGKIHLDKGVRMIEQETSMNLVLVAIHIEASARAVPLGPAMLASVLKQVFPTSVRTRILDLFLHQDAESCAEQILASDPDWVGLSIYVWNRLLSREIA